MYHNAKIFGRNELKITNGLDFANAFQDDEADSLSRAAILLTHTPMQMAAVT